jgi:hypothetical protein
MSSGLEVVGEEGEVVDLPQVQLDLVGEVEVLVRFIEQLS